MEIVLGFLDRLSTVAPVYQQFRAVPGKSSIHTSMVLAADEFGSDGSSVSEQSRSE